MYGVVFLCATIHQLLNHPDMRITYVYYYALFAQNPPPCAEFWVLRRIEENLQNGAKNAKILVIFVNAFTYNG